jgi:hypothetical protein
MLIAPRVTNIVTDGIVFSEGENTDTEMTDFSGGYPSAEVSPECAMDIDVEIVGAPAGTSAGNVESESQDSEPLSFAAGQDVLEESGGDCTGEREECSNRGGNCEDVADKNNVAVSDDVDTATGVLNAGANMGTRDDRKGSALHDEQYRKLNKLIDKYQKELRTKKVLTSDSRATDKIFDLQALKRFNERQHQLRKKLNQQLKQYDKAPAKIRSALKAKHRPIHPTKQASEEVAEALGKGNYYGRRLRDSANHLLRTGLILENRQGQGAKHETWLNKFDVRSGVQRFARGQIPFEEGGFSGQVCVVQSRFQAEAKWYFIVSYGQPNCVVT